MQIPFPRPLVALALTALALSAAAIARADLTIETRTDSGMQHLYLSEQRFSGDTPEGRMIFRGDRDLLWALDPERSAYSELTAADVQALGAQMDQARAQMQEALKSAPPEHREMMEKMMAGKMPGLRGTTRTVVPTGESRTINGFPTKGYRVEISGGDVTEVWAADPAAIEVDPADLQVLQEFAAFMSAVIPGTDAFKELVKDYGQPGEDDVPGFPILTVHKDGGGKELWRSEVVRIEKGEIPAERFEVPQGYTKEESPLGR